MKGYINGLLLVSLSLLLVLVTQPYADGNKWFIFTYYVLLHLMLCSIFLFQDLDLMPYMKMVSHIGNINLNSHKQIDVESMLEHCHGWGCPTVPMWLIIDGANKRHTGPNRIPCLGNRGCCETDILISLVSYTLHHSYFTPLPALWLITVPPQHKMGLMIRLEMNRFLKQCSQS